MNERSIRLSNQFKRDLKKQYLLLASVEWAEILSLLAKGEALPDRKSVV